MDLICGIATKKPWLRQECGWILFNCVKSFLADPKFEIYTNSVIDKLNAHKIIRTPEGLAIWIIIRKQFPYAKLPKHVWKHGDPFSRKDLSSLADVLKDAKVQPSGEENGFESQGSAMWTAQLHFAWDVVLSELYHMPIEKKTQQKEGKESKRIDFETFWAKAVDGKIAL